MWCWGKKNNFIGVNTHYPAFDFLIFLDFDFLFFMWCWGEKIILLELYYAFDV